MNNTKQFIAFCKENELKPDSGIDLEDARFRAAKITWNHQQKKIDSIQSKINAFGAALHAIKTLIT